jgi:TPR repeat protein
MSFLNRLHPKSNSLATNIGMLTRQVPQFILFILTILFCLGGSPAHGQEKPSDAQIEEWRKAAEKGDAPTQFHLGWCYENGHGVNQDAVEAVKWYRKAAEQGLAGAQCNLGRCYDNSQGVNQDVVEAVKWYRKAAEQGLANAQYNLGMCYDNGQGVNQDAVEAVKWYRKAAEQGIANAQYNLGVCYQNGHGVKQDVVEEVKLYRKAAEQGLADAQNALGRCYQNGHAVKQDAAEAVKWYRKAAEQGFADAQFNLGVCYHNGQGVKQDTAEAVKWYRKAAEQGHASAQSNLELAQEWEARQAKRREPQETDPRPASVPAGDNPKITGTGFLITRNGYLVTNYHVVKDCGKMRVQTAAGLLDAALVRVDAASDLALLKVNGAFDALPVVSSRGARMGATVATVGFPNIGLQGFEPKLSKGDISSLAGIQDDVRYFQISVPVQPGNSGGPLVDERGNVVGVVTAQLSQEAALESSGVLAQNVNYAVKSSYLLSFLEAVPKVSTGMLEAKTDEQKFEAVVDDVKKAAVLILGY